jgi:hypothetical protein
MKLMGALIVVFIGIISFFVCWPSLKHAYLTAYGVPAKGTIQQRYSHETLRRTRRNYYYYLVVQYETPSGWQSVEIETSSNYYARSLQGKSVPVHYLARTPSLIVLDDDRLYPPWQILLVLGVGFIILWLPYYMLRQMRRVAESGIAVKGLITEINQRPKKRYLTVYYEFQEVPYQETIGVAANRAKADWQPGKAITLLVAPAPPPNPHRMHVMMVYPASEIKINS